MEKVVWFLPDQLDLFQWPSPSVTHENISYTIISGDIL